MRCIDCDNCIQLFCNIFKRKIPLHEAVNPIACMSFLPSIYWEINYASNLDEEIKDGK